MAEAEHPAAAAAALLNLKNGPMLEDVEGHIKQEQNGGDEAAPLSCYGSRAIQGFDEEMCLQLGVDSSSSDHASGSLPLKVPRYLDVMCKDNKGRYDLLAHRVVCLCRECEPGRAMSVVDYEEHSGYKQRYWKRSIRVLTSNGDMQLGQWLEHHGVLGHATGGSNASPDRVSQVPRAAAKEEFKRTTTATGFTGSKPKRTKEGSEQQPVSKKLKETVSSDFNGLSRYDASPANGTAPSAQMQRLPSLPHPAPIFIGLSEQLLHAVAQHQRPVEPTMQTYADRLLAINEKIQDYFLANVDQLSSSELRLMGKVIELNLFLCGGVAAPPEVLALILSVQQAILEKPPAHPIVIELVVRAIHILQTIPLPSAAEDVVMLMRLLLKQLENPNNVIIANCCSFNLLYLQVCAEGGGHVELAAVARNVYRLEDVLLKPIPVSEEQAAFIEKSVESNFARLKLLLTKAL